MIIFYSENYKTHCHSEPVYRAANPGRSMIQYMCINHSCLYILVAQKLLNCSNIDTAL
jgi:hypothetical protein